MGKKEGKRRGTACSCSFFFVVCAWLLAPLYTYFQATEKTRCDSPQGLETRFTWSLISHVMFMVICNLVPRIFSLSTAILESEKTLGTRLGYLLGTLDAAGRWVDCIGVYNISGVFQLHFFPGIAVWVVSLMCQNLVRGLHYLVNVLLQNFSIKIMTRSSQNMQARISP